MPNRLSKEVLRDLVKSNRDLYLPFPEYVNVLYLENGGWDSLSDIHEFDHLRALYAAGNCTLSHVNS
jgi:hypothetical protein